jgi:MFS superfamily sulfate permease-like transporter
MTEVYVVHHVVLVMMICIQRYSYPTNSKLLAVFAFIAWTNMLEYGQKFLGGSSAGIDKYSIPDYDWVA